MRASACGSQAFSASRVNAAMKSGRRSLCVSQRCTSKWNAAPGGMVRPSRCAARSTKGRIESARPLGPAPAFGSNMSSYSGALAVAEKRAECPAQCVAGFARRREGGSVAGSIRRSPRPFWQNPEGRVARKRAAGCDYLHRAGGRANGYGGGDFGRTYHGECSRCAVKCDAGRAGQISPQNLDGRSHLAASRQCFHKRAQPYRQAEDRAEVVVDTAGTAILGCPVEGTIGRLDQPRPRLCAIRTQGLGAEVV